MIKVITSKDNARVKYAISLKDNKNRKANKEFLCESKKSLSMALEKNLVKEVFTLEYLDIPEDIKQNLVSEEVLKKISYSVSPEVVFIASEVNNKPNKLDKLLYLDHISDPGNMGTLLRTALALGYDAVIISKDSVSIYNEKVIAASKGAIFSLPILFDDLSNYLDHQIIVSSLSDDSLDIKSFKPNNRFVLVLGNESHGASKDIINKADVLIKIPMKDIDSLNVAVAGAILMYELIK